MKALFETLLIADLLAEYSEPTDEEIKIFLADMRIETQNLEEEDKLFQLEVLEGLTLEKIRQGIKTYQETSEMVENIFKEEKEI